MAAAAASGRRRAGATIALALASAVILAGCGAPRERPPHTRTPVTFVTPRTTPTSTVPATARRPTLGPQQVPLQTGPFLATAASTTPGISVDGILCQGLRQLAYRAHVYLQVYVRGRPRTLPGGIGMVGIHGSPQPGGLLYSASTCYYWLHTRADDGLILVESPRRRSFTLGQFFAIWDQPLSADRVAGARGAVTVLVDGRRWGRDAASVPLRQHETIELAVGRPIRRISAPDWLAAGI